MNNLTFVVDGKKVDIDKNISFTRIYRGLETTDTKKNNYSLTVKFPFTYNNDLVFRRTNSLSYKSSFPYDIHTCDVANNGVVLIIKAVLVLLSTTDSYECALTWDNFDNIGAILNNDTKLGVFLKDFPFVEWNYNGVATYDEDTYSTLKANTYGYLPYKDFTGTIEYQHFATFKHPMINFNYLLGLIFTELAVTLSIPTTKNDFLQSLVIRPNKEFDINTNNVFQAKMHVINTYIMFPYALQFDYRWDMDLSPGSPTFGRNSYYFKTWIDSNDGDDGLAINYGNGDIPQTKRIKAYGNTTNNVITISNFSVTVGGAEFVRYRGGFFTVLFNLLGGNGTHYFDAEDGDWYFFNNPSGGGDVSFDFTINTTVLEDELIPNPLRFPSMYHIPTCIDMTVAEFIKQALDITCSELTYDRNSDTYYFSERTKENSSAYDITKNITSIKEITYDTKYIYSKLGQINIFKYYERIPIDADYVITVVNDKLVPTITFINLLFSTSNTVSGGTYDGTCEALEHNYVGSEEYILFEEEPLHLLYNNTTTNKVYFDVPILEMENIFNEFWALFFADLEALALAGTVRLLKINTEITDIEFKRINTKGTVYIKTYGKYYGVIEITKNGDFAEFFLLELY